MMDKLLFNLKGILFCCGYCDYGEVMWNVFVNDVGNMCVLWCGIGMLYMVLCFGKFIVDFVG